MTLWLLFVCTAVFTLEPKRCIGPSVAFHVNVHEGRCELRFPWTRIRERVVGRVIIELPALQKKTARKTHTDTTNTDTLGKEASARG